MNDTGTEATAPTATSSHVALRLLSIAVGIALTYTITEVESGWLPAVILTVDPLVFFIAAPIALLPRIHWHQKRWTWGFDFAACAATGMFIRWRETLEQLAWCWASVLALTALAWAVAYIARQPNDPPRRDA